MRREDDVEVEKLRPRGPPRVLQSWYVKLLLVLLSPVWLLLLLLWGVLGRLLTLSAKTVAGLAIAITWVLYFCIPHMPTHLLDWPLVMTGVLVLDLCVPKRQWVFQLALWLGLMVYGITRATLADLESGTTEKRIVDTLAVLCCIFPAWLSVCSLHLWLAADEEVLEKVEKQIYDHYVVSGYNLTKVAGLGTVHVPYCGDGSRLPPRNLVLVHGYMAGNAFWAANLQTLAKFFNVYAVEWKGIGRSVRPKFKPKTEQDMDDFYVESLEDWRKEIQLDRFILCGHSMGAMYSTYYAEKYAKHIEHLVLVSPAGVNASGMSPEDLHWFWKFISRHFITPMSAIRFAGPCGLGLVQWVMKMRINWTPPTNIIRSGELDFNQITLYCYHNWALKPSGDIALHTHLHPGASAQRRPLSDILTPAKIQVPLTIMYGGGSDWMNAEYGEAVVRRLEKTHYAVFRLVPLAGHQVFMDNPTDFNHMLIDAVHDHERSLTSPMTLQ